MRNAGLDEAQAGIKITVRNINNLNINNQYLRSAIRVVSSAYLRLFISPRHLESSLCFIQSSISHDIFCI